MAENTDIMIISKNFAESGYFKDATSVAKAYVKIMTGRELGFGAMASMSGISIIQDKPVIGANLMAAKIRPAGYDYQITKNTVTEASIDFFNSKGRLLGTSTFTMEDAKVAGLSGKDNWRKYPRNMLFARAISNGIKWFCPDCLNGVTAYTPDEMGVDEDADGNPIIKVEKFETPPTQSLGDIIGNQNSQDAEFTEEPPDYLKKPVPDNAQSAKPEAPALPTEIDSDEAIRIKLWGILQSRNAGTEPYPHLCADAKKDLKEFSTYKEFKPIDRLDWLKEARLRTVYGKAKDKYPAPKEDALFPIPKLKSEPMVYGDNAELPL